MSPFSFYLFTSLLVYEAQLHMNSHMYCFYVTVGSSSIFIDAAAF